MAAPFYLAIHGRLVVIGKEPDGDSVRYQHPPGAVQACYVPTAERLKLHGRLFVAFIPATAKWPELDYYDAHGERVGLGAGGPWLLHTAHRPPAAMLAGPGQPTMAAGPPGRHAQDPTPPGDDQFDAERQSTDLAISARPARG